jgi:hypothetical protein
MHKKKKKQQSFATNAEKKKGIKSAVIQKLKSVKNAV